MARVTLLTDFGTRDGFVGAVRGTLATLAPEVRVEDVSHDLPRGEVSAGVRALARYWRRWPEGTVHLVVVDPGVGTGRRALACASDGRFLVGPDNGVLTPALEVPGARCFRLAEGAASGPVSATFHARDLFAPAAAHLASGRPIEALGEPVPDPVRLERTRAVLGAGGARGEVVGVDRFGNATTDIPGEWAIPGSVVAVAGLRLPVRRTYGDVASGEALALVDSEGWIEVAVRDGSAAEHFEIAIGAPVTLRLD